jgi:hypothetical protein
MAKTSIRGNERQRHMASSAEAGAIVAFVAGAVLGAAIRRAAEERNMTLSEFLRSVLLDELPADVREAAARDVRELETRPKRAGGRPRKYPLSEIPA